MVHSKSYQIIVTYDDEGRVEVSGKQLKSRSKSAKAHAPILEVFPLPQPLIDCPGPLKPNPAKCPPFRLIAELKMRKNLDLEVIDLRLGDVRTGVPSKKRRPIRPWLEQASKRL